MKLTNLLNEDTLPKEVMDTNITKEMIQKYRENGLVLCYAEDGKLKEFTGPIKPFQAHARRIYAISQDKFDKVQELSDNIEQMIELHKKKIELYKKYVLGALQKLTKDNETGN